MRYILLLSALILFNCSERVPDYLHYQYSPDSTTIIYSYYFNSSYAFTDEQTGFKIGSSEQGFSMNLPELNGDYISRWSSGTDLTAVNLVTEGVKSTEPRTTKLDIGNSQIELLEYSVTRSTSAEYKFDSLTTTDSIRFHGIEKVYGDSRYDRTKFPFGPVKIESSEEGNVIEIQIRTLIPYQDHLQQMTYRLKPKKPLSIERINSHGIFKQIKSW